MTGKQFLIIIAFAAVTAAIAVVILKLLGIEGAGMMAGGIGGGVAGAAGGAIAAKSQKK